MKERTEERKIESEIEKIFRKKLASAWSFRALSFTTGIFLHFHASCSWLRYPSTSNGSALQLLSEVSV